MLLTISNYKLQKAAKFTDNKYAMAGLALAPASHSGYNVCPASTAGCRDACVLWFAGRTVMPNVRNAMIRRTRMFFEDREKFKSQLYHEVELFTKFHHKKGAQGVIRLNVASDLDWVKLFPEIFKIPNSYFIDYTKVISRFKKTLPPNYELTYSVNENTQEDFAQSLLESGRNVCVVTDIAYNSRTGLIGDMPKNFQIGDKFYPVTDGDRHDIRSKALDGSGVVVILRFKGGKKRLTDGLSSGFVRGGV